MSRRASWLLALAGLNGACGVAMGALAAHGSGIDADVVDTASRYQLVHAALLIGVVWLAETRDGVWPIFAGALTGLGCLLFCGGLYAWGIGAITLGRSVAPFGGTALILGWLTLVPAAFAMRRRMARPAATPTDGWVS